MVNWNDGSAQEASGRIEPQHTPRSPLLVKYEEAARILSVSVRVVKQLVADRELRVVRFGRAVTIPVSELERFVRQHTD